MEIWEWAQNLGPHPGAPPATLPGCDTNSPGADRLAREAPLDSPTAAAHTVTSEHQSRLWESRSKNCPPLCTPGAWCVARCGAGPREENRASVVWSQGLPGKLALPPAYPAGDAHSPAPSSCGRGGQRLDLPGSPARRWTEGPLLYCLILGYHVHTQNSPFFHCGIAPRADGSESLFIQKPRIGPGSAPGLGAHPRAARCPLGSQADAQTKTR